MKENELEIAVRDYVKKMGISRPVGSINFIAKRGESGIETTVDIEEPGTSNLTSITEVVPVSVTDDSDIAPESDDSKLFG